MEKLSDFQLFLKSNNLKQKQVADYLGTSPQFVNQVARGLCALADDKLALLAGSEWDISMLNIPSYITDKVKPAVMRFFPISEVAKDANQYPSPVTASVIPSEIIEEIREEVKEELANTVAIEQPPIIPDRIVRNPDVNVMEWLDNSDGEHSQNAFNIASIMRRTKFVIQMNNNAMSPTLYQNEYVFLKPFAKDSEIIDGEIYGIETKARGILIRFLYDDGEYIITRPKNTMEYGEIKILKSDIINKYHIVFHGSTHLSSLPDNEAERTKRISMQGEQINSLINELGKAGSRNDKLIAILEKKL